MPHGGIVRIHAQRTSAASLTNPPHQAVEIRVEDEGPGIPPENRERIFAPFFTTKLAGTGLGLALTHKIICAHHGSIEISSAPVRGCCVTMCLPTVDDAESSHALTESSIDSVPQRLKGRKHEETNYYS
jgi:signal transduction histidine kinase